MATTTLVGAAMMIALTAVVIIWVAEQIQPS